MSSKNQKKNLDPEQAAIAQHRAQVEADKAKRKRTLYAVIAIVVIIAVAALLIWDSGIYQKHATALTVGDDKYTVADLDYYYYTAYNNYYSTYAYYGLIDSSTDLKEQQYDENTTWHEYFQDAAVTTLTQVSILCREAAAAGFTLSESGQESVDSTLASIDATCASYGISRSQYFTSTFGPYMTEKAFLTNLTNSALASEYAEYISGGMEVSSDELQSYYEENADSYDTFEYDAYYFKGTAASTTDSEGNTVEPTDEESAAAMAQAKEGADEMLAALKAGDDAQIDSISEEYGAVSYSNVTYFSSSAFNDWLVAASIGDTGIVESDTGYYALRLNDRYLDDYALADVRHILIKAEIDEGADESTQAQLLTAKATAEDILAQWMSGEATEESFAALAEEYSEDSGSNTNGGLYTGVYKGYMVAEFEDWLFAPGRKSGDTDIIYDSTYNAYHVMYFVGYNDRPYWEEQITSTIQAEKYNAWYEEISAGYSVTQGSTAKLTGDN